MCFGIGFPAVGAFSGTGWSVDQYDALIAQMSLDGHSAPSVWFHWAAVTDDRVHAVDVYASRDVADRLVAEPIVAELGLPAPKIHEFEIRGYLTPN